MAKRIEKLTLRHFRGATKPVELEFNAKKPMVMIFGENGTGKSTLIDSIDLVCNENGGSIRDRSSTENKHLASLGYNSAEVSVELVYGGQSWKGSLGAASRPSVSGASPKPPVFILRRSQLLKLMESSPSDRYIVLQGFLAVDGVESSEAGLLTALKETKKKLDAAITKKTTAEASLTGLWNAEGQPDGDAVTWAVSKTSNGIEGHQQTGMVLKRATDAIKRAREVKAAFVKAVADEALAQATVQSVRDEIERAEAVSAADALKMIELLQKAQSFLLNKGNVDECPVCEQSIQGTVLLTSISARLQPMTHLCALQGKHEAAKRTHEQAALHLERTKGGWAQVGVSIIEATKGLEEVSGFVGLPAALAGAVQCVTSDESGMATSEALLAAWEPLLQELEGHLVVAQKAINQFNLIKASYTQMTEAAAAAAELQAVYEQLERAAEIVKGRRHSFLQGVLDAARDECNRLYATIHPDEPIGLSEVVLKPGAKAAITQEATFEGHERLAPQAYFSESHLDTLGFCLWLAVAKLHCNGDGVVVLDDVFTSVDATHFSRIIDLLAVEGPTFSQMIITTHSRHWFDRIRTHHQMGKNIDLVRLHRWAPQHGIRHDRAELAVKELALKVDAVALDRQAVASQAGILLEAVFDLMARQYRCKLPVTYDSLYTLGDLLGAMGQIKGHEVRYTRDPAGGDEDVVVLKPLLDKLNALAFIRNQVGAHFNLLGSDVPDNEVERFGRLAVEVVTALSCQACGEIPRKDKGTYFACKCKKSRMLPLTLA